ncbi:hypothetical protein ASPACDRAFT_40210 [Aspergillus aculeatus ATCC 16872]|uniref:Uncharacterized protein n=1 Tax=Aspergillus aculeatus (strain ATCC 16872 / CBS 172.66 / WB 5094) TaxID=690307 RepID=A0A1L9X368_ASPA1|nr:uncharacterized protein ASPACDRAFT_40210 [Aspergillus aculeatus ATCC 16872]OJK02895.1 hypothetical protein ASPACDRAFT_40210 [Aspergillus aculeatus ATCC 16872]
MKKAIHSAGFEHRNATVCFTTEAEAAAMYAAHESGFNMRQFSEELQMVTRAKRSFGFFGSSFSEWAQKAFPAGPGSVIDPNWGDLPSEVIEASYISLVTKTVGYIRQQVDCATIYVGRDVIKKLLLVGGLTQSPEISARIRNIVENEFHITVYLPIDV